MNNYNRLVAIIVSVIFISISFFITFNIYIDPYGIYSNHNQKNKIIYKQNERIRKIILSKKLSAKKIFLGTSTIRDGITKEYYDSDTINLSFNSQSPYESLMMIKNINRTDLKEVNLGLDFFIFSKYWEDTLYLRGFNENLYLNNKLKFLKLIKLNLSLDTFRSSLAEIKYGDSKNLIDSQINNVFINFQSTDYETFDKEKIAYFLKRINQFNYDENYSYSDSYSKLNSFAAIIDIIELCLKEGLKINLIINPTHNSEKFLLDSLNLKEKYFDWVSSFYSISDKYNINLYNFSVINNYTNIDIESFNKYFSDPIHFRLDLSKKYISELNLNNFSKYHYKNMNDQAFRAYYNAEIEYFISDLGISFNHFLNDIKQKKFIGIEINE